MTFYRNKTNGKDSYLEDILFDGKPKQDKILLDKDGDLELYLDDRMNKLSIRYANRDVILNDIEIYTFRKKGFNGLFKKENKKLAFIINNANYPYKTDSIMYKIEEGKLIHTNREEISSLIDGKYKFNLKRINQVYSHSDGEYPEIVLQSANEHYLSSLSKQLTIGSGVIIGSYILEGYLISSFSIPYSNLAIAAAEIATILAYVYAAPRVAKRLLRVKWQEDERLKKIASDAGVKLNGVALAPTGTPNAFTSPDKTIVITEGLVKRLNQRETLATFYHELGHIKQHGFLKAIIPTASFIGALNYLTSTNNVAYDHISYVLTVGYMAYVLMLYPRFLHKSEYSADKFAAENGFSEEVASGLMKMSDDYFSDGSITHPSTNDRICNLGLSPDNIAKKVIEGRNKEGG